MVTPGQLYTAIVIILLLFALGLSIPVLKRILVEGLERRQKWNAGELKRDTDDEASNRDPHSILEEETDGHPHLTCRQCGAANDPGFRYCHRCTAKL
ncbi:zinc ribbon domain-containing protein [Natronorubrum thiooxidans]|uniref:DUF7577 domain-containing protein n=1 Tax=Natronorubrum thiooxidans TaxID=308853 RepID=A0A1N7H270_9EURY|nr:zinc ribbon domain-containing protein [Natronorubrum thiooxidans]SIS18860.1 hypothetical protein SAMN05421752_12118 [Natronorubrum thiooxidans]